MIELAILVGIVIALIEVIKKINKPKPDLEYKFIDENWLPVIAIFLGVVINLISGLASGEVFLNGIIAGLVAVGGYDGAKGIVTIRKKAVLRKKELENK